MNILLPVAAKAAEEDVLFTGVDLTRGTMCAVVSRNDRSDDELDSVMRQLKVMASVIIRLKLRVDIDFRLRYKPVSKEEFKKIYDKQLRGNLPDI